ncbi:unnamed protein product [Arabis nemorensis]|uniref:Ubiquitin carboxyl-terminal hydrolase n=1 Tax=Arabis nemorensis TaxID=586526 RepID=A0A565BFY7_9BRAS|nr:unnamed protein product [Arabis nemorensis]
MAAAKNRIACEFYRGGLGICYKGGRCPYSHAACFPHQPEDNRGLVGEKLLQEAKGDESRYRDMKDRMLDFMRSNISAKDFMDQADALGLRHKIPEIAASFSIRYRAKYDEILEAMKEGSKNKKNGVEDCGRKTYKDSKNNLETRTLKFVEEPTQNSEKKKQESSICRISKKKTSLLSKGLVNLGNTCYLNSTLQCLKAVPELQSALSRYSLAARGNNDIDHMLTVATHVLFSELDKSLNAIFRKKYPQFSQMEDGIYMQQDAEECWTQLLHTLSQSLKTPTSSENHDVVTILFGLNLQSRLHCPESGEESSETESVYALKCHISHEVNHMLEGLHIGLREEIAKTSPLLGRTALYLKESFIEYLPSYLTVQFLRYFWKKETCQQEKILRKVDLPLELDVFELCTDDLKKTLTHDSKGSDVGRKTGLYDLVSVLSHKGKTANTGHYMAWVNKKQVGWVFYDDHRSSLKNKEDFMKLLSGGDDSHAYIAMYKARVSSH